MQTISDTLAAAAASLRGRPAVWAELRNRRLRWQLCFREDLGDNENAAMIPAVGALLRARGTAGGQVLTAHVSDPARRADWFTWSLARDDAVSYCEVALTITRAGRLRLVYVRADGTAFRVSACESTDRRL
jgi:hypothetical protein